MDYSRKAIRVIYIEYFSHLFESCPRALLEDIRKAIDPVAGTLAETFYRFMLNDTEASRFLDHVLVHRHLHDSMTRWLQELFVWRGPEEIARFVDTQLHVGEVHARVDLPPHILNLGFRVLKAALAEQLKEAYRNSPERLAEALAKTHALVDIASAVMNESYFGDIMTTERQAQALQAQVVGQNLVVRIERIRADIFDWQRRIVTKLHQNKAAELEQLPSAVHSDFGLWITHKASLFFSGSAELAKLELYLRQLDELVPSMAEARSSNDGGATLDDAIQKLDSLVTRISWLLSSLAERYAEADAGRDTLTRLFNRRFLDPILQRETRHSLRTGSRYALLLVDLDHFKRVNDSYGHEAGDCVLRQCAELLQSHIRAGDFLFRYGGEEFLIVMVDVQPSQAEHVADKLVELSRRKRYRVNRDTEIGVTISLGVAIHDGHPDFGTLLAQADRALYRAKNSGRDRYVVADAAEAEDR
ncbi:GGDEF domain-containing protein [Methylogaea oryzae]|uniref:Diguanylate cyclase DosC n=1 Tax=Methylogaea oryzae TaxID=1295382 RepID=A0A8D4VMC5_9GAMM|nr:GGDEF domain-containing protein [Methylogaea oryzae]BBL69894.1 diguanylate cyclase [Methylogaea oryzae]